VKTFAYLIILMSVALKLFLEMQYIGIQKYGRDLWEFYGRAIFLHIHVPFYFNMVIWVAEDGTDLTEL
jgi:hypothetical protein